jgi:hypothetical protein
LRSLTFNLGADANSMGRSIEGWFRDFLSRPFKMRAYTVANLPAAGDWTDTAVICSNETGGRTIVTSDGTNWRRVRDGAVAS